MMNKEAQVIYDFVDQSLKSLEAMDLARLPIHDMPREMRDETRQPSDDWIPWKPVQSTVTDNDLHDIEKITGRRFPESYRLFLKYKHFYELDTPNPMEVVFFRHPIRDWKKEFVAYYAYDWVKERLLNKGFIPFAGHQDWGVICFDANRNAGQGEYPVVMIDHEVIYDEPIPFEAFGDNFIDMIKRRLTTP